MFKPMDEEKAQAVFNCPFEMPGGMCNRDCPLKRNNKCQFSFAMFKAWVKGKLQKQV